MFIITKALIGILLVLSVLKKVYNLKLLKAILKNINNYQAL